jgi:hypothetical protein
MSRHWSHLGLPLAVAALWVVLIARGLNAASQRGGLAVRALATPPILAGTGPWAWEKVQLSGLSWAQSLLLRAPTLLGLALLAVTGTILLLAAKRESWRAGWWESVRFPVTGLLVALSLSGWFGWLLAATVIQPPDQAGPRDVPVELGWLAAAVIWHALTARRSATATSNEPPTG